jgi:hypothetical protein
MEYECIICCDTNIAEKNIVYMSCLQYLCYDCYTKLLTPNCPFCREELPIFHTENEDSIFLIENDYFVSNSIYYNDFIIPRRQENKRNKKNKKKEILNSIIENDILNTDISLPNYKIRSNRKQNNIFC